MGEGMSIVSKNRLENHFVGVPDDCTDSGEIQTSEIQIEN